MGPPVEQKFKVILNFMQCTCIAIKLCCISCDVEASVINSPIVEEVLKDGHNLFTQLG